MSDVKVTLSLQDEASAKLTKISSEAQNTAKSMQNAGRQMDNAFKTKAPDNLASRLGNAVNTMADDVSSLGRAVEKMSQGTAQSLGDKLTEGFDGAAQEVNELTEAVEKLDGAYQDAKGRWHDASGDFINLPGDSGFPELADDVEGVGEAMDRASGKAFSLGGALKTLFAAVAGAKVLGEVKEFGEESLASFTDLESGMREVSTLLPDLSSAGLADMTQDVREFSLETGKLPEEVVPALYQAISASVPQDTVFDFLEKSNQAAVGGVTEVGTAVDGLSSVVNAYGSEVMSVGTASDMMFTAVKLGKTTFGELAGSLYNVVPTAVGAGVGFENITGAIAAMTAQGVPTAQATTQIRQALVELTDTGGQVDKAFRKIAGESFKEFIAGGNNLSQALDLLDDHAKESGLGVNELFSSVEAGNAALALTGNGAAIFAKDIEAMKTSAGATEEAYAKMTDTFEHKTGLIAANMEDIRIEAGEALAGALAPAADELLDNMDDIREPVVGLFSSIGDAISSAAPLIPGFLDALSSGAAKLGDAVRPLFETVLKNPQAVAKAFTSVGVGMAVFKGASFAKDMLSTADGASKLSQALGKFGGVLTANPWITGAAALTAGVIAIKSAIDEYNDIQINESLAEHFGSIELDTPQIGDFASRVINADWLVNINTALGHFENADKLEAQAEDALAENNALEWKARVGIELTEDEQSSYLSNIETFSDNIEKALSERTLAAKMVVDEFEITNAEGISLGSKIAEWANSDLQEVSNISAGLTNLVQSALEDGIIDVDEQAAIDQLQQKISDIMSGWKEAEAQAEMDMLTQKYGRLSGADLEAGTFTSLVTELGEQRESAAEALYESEKEVYATLNALNRTNEEGIQRISDSDLEFYKEQVAQAARNAEVAMLMNSVNFEKNTMEDAYGDLLTSNYQNIETGAQESVNRLGELYAQYQNGTASMETLFSSMENSVFDSSAGTGKGLFGFVTDADQAALSNIYEAMKPDMQSLQDVISEYQEIGQAVPREIMSQFNDAMLLGAAAGDDDAAWYTYARQMAESGNNEMVEAIKSGELSAPQELRDALELATTEVTDEPITIDVLQTELKDIEVDQARVDELINRAFKGLETTGETTTINGEVAVEYEVTAGQTLSEIAAQAGMALDDLLAANPQITNPDVINIGEKINIPADKVDTDVSGLTEAAQNLQDDAQKTADAATPDITTAGEINGEYTAGDANGTEAAAEELGRKAKEEAEATDPPTTQQDIPTTITFEVASLDNSALADAVTEQLQAGEAVPITVPADVIVSAGEISTTKVITAATDQTRDDLIAAFATAFDTPGKAIVALTEENNVSAIYNEVGNAATNAFAAGYNAAANVDVTLTASYHLANPVKTLTFGGGATGSAAITAALHAEGGYFDEPHLGMVAEAGVGEYIIPMDGSDRSIGMWEDAGRMLGIDMQKSSGALQPISTLREEAELPTADTFSNEKTINVNVNGSGNIKVNGGGASKEQVVEIMLENLRSVFLQIVEQEVLEEGDMAYEY